MTICNTQVSYTRTHISYVYIAYSYKPGSAYQPPNSCLAVSSRRCGLRREPLSRGQHPDGCEECSRETRQKQEPGATPQEPKHKKQGTRAETRGQKQDAHGRSKDTRNKTVNAETRRRVSCCVDRLLRRSVGLDRNNA